MEEIAEKTNDLGEVSRQFQERLNFLFEIRKNDPDNLPLSYQKSSLALLEWIISLGIEEIFEPLFSFLIKGFSLASDQTMHLFKEAAGRKCPKIISFGITSKLIKTPSVLLNILLQHNKLNLNEKIEFIRMVLTSHPDLISPLLIEAQESYHPTEPIMVALLSWQNNFKNALELQPITMPNFPSIEWNQSIPDVLFLQMEPPPLSASIQKQLELILTQKIETFTVLFERKEDLRLALKQEALSKDLKSKFKRYPIPGLTYLL